MITRQAIFRIAYRFVLISLTACSASSESHSTLIAPTASLPSPVPMTATPIQVTPTPLTCLSQAGRVQQDVVATTNPPQEFIIYLPPCYDDFVNERFPVLYLLHGQTYTQDQWQRLGAFQTADQLIHANEATPFIIVLPDDRYWNLPAGGGFGFRLINDIIPYVDAHYRTRASREHRALGGLSRGGGWTAKLGFDHPELFGALGLHSPAFFKDNAPYLEQIIQNISDANRPKLWLDIGDRDTELRDGVLFAELLTRNNYVYEYHRFAGDHTEIYWNAHVNLYLRWYVQNWQSQSADG